MATTSTSRKSSTKASGLPKRLLLDGIITEDAYLDANQAANEAKTALVSYLVEKKIAAANDIAQAASSEFGMPLFDVNSLEIDQDVVSLVSADLIQKFHFLPLFKRDKKLYVAVPDPIAFKGLDEIKFQTSFSVETIVVEEDKLKKKIEKALESLDDSMSDLGGDDFDLENLDIEEEEDNDSGITRADTEDAPVVRFINKMLLDAIKQGVSDIHFEPYEKAYRVRYRQDGMLREVARPPVNLSGKMAARVLN